MSYINGKKVAGIVAINRNGTPANKITYDNTESGLEATNAQAAIDKLNNEVENTKKEMSTDYVAYNSQTLSETKKQQARNNIGAGTSNFSGSYNDLTDKPTIISTENLASKDLSNVTYPSNTAGSTKTGAGDRVIETYISSDGNTWYRKWASGWKECGMYYTNSSAGLSGSSTVGQASTLQISFPITFSNTNYNTQVTNAFAASGGHTLAWDVSSTKYTDSCKFTVVRHGSSSVNSVACYIYVCGY